MTYFLTGATGFIGGRIAQQLAAAGHLVRCLARDVHGAKRLGLEGVEWYGGDIIDRETMRAPMKGVDGVFHAAAWYKVGAPDARVADAINVGGTRNVLELMRELRVPKGVYTSTLAVFSDTRGNIVDESFAFHGVHLSEYDRTKAIAHYEVAMPMMKEGLPLVIVQPGLVYGPGDTSSAGRVLRQYLQGRLPLLPRGTAFCWAHVEDVAHGRILAMQKGKPGDTYILAGPPHTLVEALQIAERLTRVPAPRLRAGPGILRGLSRLMEIVERVVPVPDQYRAEVLRVSAGFTYLGDNRKARRELGYSPCPLEQGLRETLEHELRRISRRAG